MSDEQEAIARLRRGDIAGLEYLVNRYQTSALRAAVVITCDPAAAEDIVQAAFLRAYERIAQFDVGRPFGPWFIRSVVHDAIKVAKRQQRQVPIEDSPKSSSALVDWQGFAPADIADSGVAREAVRGALQMLTPAQRAALVYRYFFGLSEVEIAAEMARPRSAIKWLLHAGRGRLRVLLSRMGLGLGAEE